MLHYFPGARMIPQRLIHLFTSADCERKFHGPVATGLLVSRHGPRPERFLGLNWVQVGEDWWIAPTAEDGPRHFLRYAHEAQRGDFDRLVTLADGNNWLIPVADPESARCALPKAEAPWWNPGAKRLEIRQQVLPAHAEFARLAVKAALSLRDGLAGGSISLDLEDGDYRRLCHLALSYHYDLLPEEILALQLIGPAQYASVIGAVIDQEAILATFLTLRQEQPLPFASGLDSPPSGLAPDASPHPVAAAPTFILSCWLRFKAALGVRELGSRGVAP